MECVGSQKNAQRRKVEIDENESFTGKTYDYAITYFSKLKVKV